MVKKFKELGKQIGSIIASAGMGWIDDGGSRLGAALACYTVFSIGPLMLIAIALASMLFGPEAAQHQIYATLSGFLGETGAKGIEDVVNNANHHSTGALAAAIGIVTLLFGATGVFGELHSALNMIWRVEARKGRSILAFLRERFLSFAMVFGTGFLLLVSLLITAALSATGRWVSSWMPGGEFVWKGFDYVFSLTVISGIFAMIFRLVPDVRFSWKAVWPGAIVTAVLFTLGKVGLGFYISKANVASAYGAAGSLIVVVMWVFYSAQIVYFGAELVRAYVGFRKDKVEAKSLAQPIAPKESPAGAVKATFG